MSEAKKAGAPRTGRPKRMTLQACIQRLARGVGQVKSIARSQGGIDRAELASVVHGLDEDVIAVAKELGRPEGEPAAAELARAAEAISHDMQALKHIAGPRQGIDPAKLESAARRLGSSVKALKERAVQGAADADISPVVLRFDATTKRLMNEAIDESNNKGKSITQSDLITNLLKLYKSMSESERRRVREGLYVSPIKEVAEILTRTSAANHTFNRRNWPRCLDDHLALLKCVSGRKELEDYEELEGWVLYRLGFVWHSNSYRMRKLAIELFRDSEPANQALGKSYLLQTLDALEEAQYYSDSTDYSIQALHNRICHRSFAAQVRMEYLVVNGNFDDLGGDASTCKAMLMAPDGQVPLDGELIASRGGVMSGEDGLYLKHLVSLYNTLLKTKPTLPVSQLVVKDVQGALTSLERFVDAAEKAAEKGDLEDAIPRFMAVLDKDPDLFFLTRLQQPSEVSERYKNILKKMQSMESQHPLLGFYTSRLRHIRQHVEENKVGTPEK